MYPRTVEIECLQERLMITALIHFNKDLEYESKYTEIIKVIDLEENEGSALVPIKDEHYNLVERHWETHAVGEEL